MSAEFNEQHVAKHEAAHVVALHTLGGHFRRVVVRQNACGAYAGEVEEPAGELRALLVCAVAGAVSDAGPIGCGDWRIALRHLTTEKCCSADYVLCRDIARRLDAGRSVAEVAINTALHALADNTLLWKATTAAVLHTEWEYPGDTAAERSLWHWRDSYTPIPNCPSDWSDFASIAEWATEQAVAAR